MITQTLRSRLILASALYVLVAALFPWKTPAVLATDSTINNSLGTRDLLQQADAEEEDIESLLRSAAGSRAAGRFPEALEAYERALEAAAAADLMDQAAEIQELIGGLQRDNDNYQEAAEALPPPVNYGFLWRIIQPQRAAF